MDVAGGFSSILYLLKLKDLVRKKKRTNVVLRSEKLKQKSPSSKNLVKNINLDCNEIEKKSVNDSKKIKDNRVLRNEKLKQKSPSSKNLVKNINLDCNEIKKKSVNDRKSKKIKDNRVNIDCKKIKDKSVNIDCKEIENTNVGTKKDEITFQIFKKSDLMPSIIPVEPSIIPAEPSIIPVKPKQKHATEMCELCGVVIRKTSMETHMNVHLKRKPYVCNFKNCGRSFSSPQAFCCHKKLHTLSKEFKCNICSAEFHLKGNLRKHEASHLEPTFKCLICERMFKTTETLKFHMNKHKDSENLSCTYPSCEKKLKNSSSLREHLRKYHNIRVRERVAKC